LRAAGRTEAALGQRDAQFREQPTPAAYQALRAEAEQFGAWPRERSVRVAILLWEGDTAGAWEQAHAGGCSRDLWRALARARPDDAIAVYRRLLSAAIDQRNDSGYDGAIELLAELHFLLAPLGRQDEHAALVTELREVHRRKTNLIERLDVQQWEVPCP
jgi:uncharacterized Zn finger protein